MDAIGAWQNGWKEDQERREGLARELEKQARPLPDKFKNVSGQCYRKRFIHKGEMVQILLADERREGFVSWTTDKAYAEQFKNYPRPDAVSGAVFRHLPDPSEVLINIASLWDDEQFVAAAGRYRDEGGEFAKALFNFAAKQGEVVLSAPLRGSEIIRLTGVSSHFDVLCDDAGITDEAERDRLFKMLVDKGIYPGGYDFIGEEASQRAVMNAIEKTHELIERALAEGPRRA